MDRFARIFNLSNGAAAIMVACFLTLPGLRVSAENPSGVNAEVNAPQNINIKGRIVDQNGLPVIGASLFQQGTNNGTVAPRLWWSATELRKEPTSPALSPLLMSVRHWKAVLSPMSAVDFRVLSRE